MVESYIANNRQDRWGSTGPPMEQSMSWLRTCRCCHKTYAPMVEWQKFCCERCKNLRTHANYLSYFVRRCEYCNDEFNPTRKWQKFCSPEHAHAHWNEKNDVAQLMRDYRARLRAEGDDRTK